MIQLQSDLSLLDALDSRFIADMEHGIRTLVRDPRFQQVVFKGFQNFIFSKAVNHKQTGEDLQTFCLQLFDRTPKLVPSSSTCISKPNEKAEIDFRTLDLGYLLSSEQWDPIVFKCLENVDEDIDSNLQDFCDPIVFKCLENVDEEIDSNLQDFCDPIVFKCLENVDEEIDSNLQDLCDPIVFKCLENVDEEIDSNLQDFCFEVLGRLLQANNPSPLFDTSRFILGTLKLLKVLMISKPNVIATVKKQMGTLANMLEFVLTIYWVRRRKYYIDEKLPNFLEYIEPWVNSAAVVPFVFWVEEMDEELCALLSSFINKFYPTTPELVEVYLRNVKDLKPSKAYEILLMRKAVGCFLNILLEDLVVSTDDHFEMLTEGLTFLTAILIHPPQTYAEDKNLILTQTNVLVNEAASWICSLSSGKLREDVAKGRNILLHDLLEKTKIAKTELRQLHVETGGNSWWKNVPQTNRKGFFDFLLGNLKKKSEAEADLFPFEKHLLAMVQKELVSIRPFLMNIFDVQDEHEEMKDIWVQAGNVAYLVDHVTDFCLSVDVPIWSNLIYLSNAIEQIQFIKSEMTKIRKNQMYKDRVINAKTNSKLIIPGREQAIATIKDDVKVGFRLEEERIIDRLTGGEVKLDIVAIVGMPGQGKTTLAHRVLQNSRVKYHFNKLAWCCVTEAYDIKKIFLDILGGVGQPVPEEEVPSVTKEDLADKLRKCLKGQRYLVVLDDIWDVKPWYELQLSFPDDNNRSRILFTSRNSDVVLKARTDCCVITLHALSFEESWSLLQLKVFEEDFCPSILSRIGRTIAENCKGLPLAIVLVAGLLKKHKNVGSWNHIARSLNSQLASEGCSKVLELSYIYLPDFLKPCFLYLGVFQEDRIIDAEKLIQFWIVEGFVQEDGMKSPEVVAYEYLSNLVDRSLVIVAKRSSRNGIKKCRVHDLLHELAIHKAKEERFLLVPNVSDFSSSTRSDHYRLCVHAKSECFVDSISIVPSLRSFLVSGSNRWYPPRFGASFAKFKLLRVLDLGYTLVDQFQFYEITQLIHLRFLSLTALCIPSSIANLMRLEIFHIFLDGSLESSLDCEPIRILPAEMMKMENLQQIFIVGGRFPDVEKLELYPPLINLETLTFFEAGDASVLQTLARKLPNLRKLGIGLRSCVRLSNYFNKLESLKLEISEEISPSTFDFPSTLKKLSLKVKQPLSGIMISSIGKLSNLEVLKLQAGFQDKKWDMEDDEFLNLKYLKLSWSNIQEWNIISDESLSCLEQLVLKRCYQLRELPCTFGEISTLKRIVVRSCNGSVSSSFDKIVDDQMANGNDDFQSSISYDDSKKSIDDLQSSISYDDSEKSNDDLQSSISYDEDTSDGEEKFSLAKLL